MISKFIISVVFNNFVTICAKGYVNSSYQLVLALLLVREVTQIQNIS